MILRLYFSFSLFSVYHVNIFFLKHKFGNLSSGTTHSSGVEIKFRGELEFLITKMYEKDGVPLPMICIMLEGGPQSIEMALNSLRMGQPLVVIKGESSQVINWFFAKDARVTGWACQLISVISTTSIILWIPEKSFARLYHKHIYQF